MHERRPATKHLTGVHYRPVRDRAGDIVYVERLRHYYGGKSLLDHISADAYGRADGAGADDGDTHTDTADANAYSIRYLDLACDSDGHHHCPSDGQT